MGSLRLLVTTARHAPGPALSRDPQFRHLIDLWHRLTGLHPSDSDDDNALWIEDTVRIREAMSIDPRTVVRSSQGAGFAVRDAAGTLSVPTVAAASPSWMESLVGEPLLEVGQPPLVDRGFLAYASESERYLSKWWELPGAQKHLGRRFVTAGYGIDMEAALSRSGAPSTVSDLSGNVRVTVHPGGGVDSSLPDSQLWKFQIKEGIPDEFIVQDALPLSSPYRVFVVDHEPVTGAPISPELTPLDNTETFDASGMDDHADAYVRAARDICSSLESTTPRLRNYALDLARSGPRVLLSTMKPLGASRLHSCDVHALIAAQYGA